MVMADPFPSRLLFGAFLVACWQTLQPHSQIRRRIDKLDLRLSPFHTPLLAVFLLLHQAINFLLILGNVELAGSIQFILLILAISETMR